jgi:class III poly(R)-hydroxyalkanoic acid synthase PhaE subunit
MDWTEQTNKMMNTWLEAQQQMWQGWLNQVQQPVSPSPEAWQESTEAVGELWGEYLKQWQQVWQKGMTMVSPLENNTADWGAFSRAQYDAFQQTFGQWLDTPTLGFSREYEEKVRRSFKLWQDVQQANLEYQAVMSEGWSLALSRLQEAMMERAHSGEPVESLTELTAAWSEVVDPAFLEVFYSEKYIRAQGKLNEAIMNYRIQQRELVELFSQLFDIPTRTEVDAAHKINHEQRNAIKALQKELSATQAQLADLQETVAKLTKPAPKRKTRSKAAASKPTTEK